MAGPALREARGQAGRDSDGAGLLRTGENAIVRLAGPAVTAGRMPARLARAIDAEVTAIGGIGRAGSRAHRAGREGSCPSRENELYLDYG